MKETAPVQCNVLGDWGIFLNKGIKCEWFAAAKVKSVSMLSSETEQRFQKLTENLNAGNGH